MKKTIIVCAFILAAIAQQAFSQCGEISLIGEFNYWNEDYYLTRDTINPDLFSTFIYLPSTTDPNQDGVIEVKFREDASWETNWGNIDFPEGTGVLNGPNIPVPYGSYFITFNCSSGFYFFEDVTGIISLIGEFNDFNGDLFMEQDPSDPNLYKVPVSFTIDQDPNLNGSIDIKFREDANWMNNWGGTDFPNGTGILNGPVLPVPYGDYMVTFNKASLEYNFELIIGITDPGNSIASISVSPNPARTTVHFVINLDKGSDVSLKIFDLNGREIATILDQHLLAGQHQSDYDVYNLEAGVYMYRLDTGNRVINGKMSVAK
jgi:starch-binding outer membrane protein SusE/F